jgi:hypothetical protein
MSIWGILGYFVVGVFIGNVISHLLILPMIDKWWDRKH